MKVGVTTDYSVTWQFYHRFVEGLAWLLCAKFGLEKRGEGLPAVPDGASELRFPSLEGSGRLKAWHDFIGMNRSTDLPLRTRPGKGEAQDEGR